MVTAESANDPPASGKHCAVREDLHLPTTRIPRMGLISTEIAGTPRQGRSSQGGPNNAVALDEWAVVRVWVMAGKRTGSSRFWLPNPWIPRRVSGRSAFIKRLFPGNSGMTSSLAGSRVGLSIADAIFGQAISACVTEAVFGPRKITAAQRCLKVVLAKRVGSCRAQIDGQKVRLRQ